MAKNSAFRGAVLDIMRSARTVRTNRTRFRTYETVLEIDKDKMLRMLRNAAIISKVDKKN